MIIYYTHKFGNNKGESHTLLSYAIGDYLGDQERADALVDSMHETGKFGKPVIEGFDCFSISHSGNTWAVLISSKNCGFDIQYYKPCNRVGIAKRFYAPQEASVVETAEAHGIDVAQDVFFGIWTRREALVKALGLSVAQTGLPSVTEPAVSCGGDTWYFGSLTIPGSKALSNSICVPEPVTEITVKEIRVREMDRTDNKNGSDNKKRSKKTALEEAYSYIASRMRTAAEVTKHLREKGYSSEETQDAVNEMIGNRYLDDYQYALRYFEYNREKRRGSLRAARELAEKGVDRQTVENAREDFLYENKVNEYEDALAAARRELSIRSGSPEADEKTIASIGRRLESRGFTRADIFRVLESIRRGDAQD